MGFAAFEKGTRAAVGFMTPMRIRLSEPMIALNSSALIIIGLWIGTGSGAGAGLGAVEPGADVGGGALGDGAAAGEETGESGVGGGAPAHPAANDAIIITTSKTDNIFFIGQRISLKAITF
jgi:hypothetical protein